MIGVRGIEDEGVMASKCEDLFIMVVRSRNI